jgi:hypothetical protein
MSQQNQSFHPQLIIVDYFNEIINQIDIRTELLLEDQSLQEESKIKLNNLREKQIEEIDQLKKLNLNDFIPEGTTLNEEEFRQKWSHVLDDDSLEYNTKIDKIKEELILYDFVLLQNPNKINGFDVWITSWFHNKMNLEFLK